jgi:calcium/calmodulin-dependent protein kinase (CaM kinase) II
MTETIESQIVALTRQLLQTIAARDWQKYAELCEESLTCFEPEARGHLVEGLDFHKYYFELPGGGGNRNTTLSAPHVRMMGSDAAVVSYVRLVQHLDADGHPQTTRFEETRVWQRCNGRWKHVHFHRSQNG